MAMSADVTRQAYARLLRDGMFGGHNEMVLLSDHYNLTTYVYSRVPGGFSKLTTVHPNPRTSHARPPRQVYMLWDGLAHYDALVVL